MEFEEGDAAAGVGQHLFYALTVFDDRNNLLKRLYPYLCISSLNNKVIICRS